MEPQWACLPDHVMASILSYLPLAYRSRAAQTCWHWYECFKLPHCWRSFDFVFNTSSQNNFVEGARMFGKCFKTIRIMLDQSVTQNRENACKVLKLISSFEDRRLENLALDFIGENPFFYAGLEFVNALSELFILPERSVENKINYNGLRHVDLRGLPVAFADNFLNTLSAHNPNLEYLNIQNRTLVCKVDPTCILRLLQRCRQLKDLNIYNYSMSDDILLALTEVDRVPIEHLSLVCRREEKYGKDIPGELWHSVSKKIPGLRITLVFDHTCPMHKVNEIMKSEIPVSVLRLETFSYIADELRMATSFYQHIIQKLVINAPLSSISPELDRALVNFAEQCQLLKSMHVFCVISQEAVDKILALHPDMKENGTYTLRSTPGVTPWIPGKDC